MIAFLLMMNLIAALFMMQLLRGLISSDNGTVEMTFYQTWNSFLSMFQLLTSENWTTVLYSALTSVPYLYQIVFAAVLLCGWFLLSYCAPALVGPH